tara:strand:+ start:173 stop:739 length:567 start_codon:yes stop_codon:yes gene_type:complete
MNKYFINLVTLLILASCVTYPTQNNVYQNLTYPKAKAVAVRQNGQYWQLTGGWGVGSGNTTEKAIEKAMQTCQNYNPYNKCVLEMVNDMNVLQQNIAKLKLQPSQPRINSQGVDWGKAAGVIGKQILDMEEARTKSVSPTPNQKPKMIYFLDSEQISGMNKICFYKSGGEYVTKTVDSVDLCPLSVEF